MNDILVIGVSFMLSAFSTLIASKQSRWRLPLAIARWLLVLFVFIYLVAFFSLYRPEGWRPLAVEFFPSTVFDVLFGVVAGTLFIQFRISRRVVVTTYEPGTANPLFRKKLPIFLSLGATLALVAAYLFQFNSKTAEAAEQKPGSELTEAQLKKLVTSNQIEFRFAGGKSEAICRCGPRVYLYQMPKFLRDAVVATEDHRFYYHRGVDLNGILRAGWRSLSSMGRRLEGGSTITQQLIKNTVLSSDQSFDRKATEAKLAWMLEQTMTKQRILEAYLNQVVFEDRGGRLIVGVEQAARAYFGRTAADLSPFEFSRAGRDASQAASAQSAPTPGGCARRRADCSYKNGRTRNDFRRRESVCAQDCTKER